MRLAALLAIAGGGCDGDDGGALPTCVSRDAEACTPLYEPTFDRVFSETIQPRCGTPGSSCHASADAMGAGSGMIIAADAAQTRMNLIDGGFVVPGDAACSTVMVRLDLDDDSRRMPPGSAGLPEGERCAIAQWIAGGAEP